MASSLITGAVSLLLILTAGYVIATGILTIAETTMYAQSDVTYNQELMRLTEVTMNSSWSSDTLSINVFNNGSTSFTSNDFSKMDLFVYPDGIEKMKRYSIDDCNPSIPAKGDDPVHGDILNIGMWDPAEVLTLSLTVTPKPDRVIFVTSNGITAISSVELIE